MISSLSNYCSDGDCNEYRWVGCDDNLCPLHCQIEELKKKLKEINEIATSTHDGRTWWNIRTKIKEKSNQTKEEV